jgi:hypothetical protein
MHISRIRRTLILAGTTSGAIAATLVAAAGSATAQRTQASLDRQLALARNATARYSDDLPLAERKGYQILTRMIPGVGYQFVNPAVTGFDVRKPQILVYEHRGTHWQLGAIGWVFTHRPAHPPLPGARYGSFGPACHYADGTFVQAENQAECPLSAPRTQAAFTFWHPRVVTMHVWLWAANPNGLFATVNPTLGYTNPLVAAYSAG